MSAHMTAADVRGLAFNVRLAYSRPVVARADIPLALFAGRWQSWRERLNRAVFAARTWEGLEDIRRRELRALNNRRVKCEVYEANAHGNSAGANVKGY